MLSVRSRSLPLRTAAGTAVSVSLRHRSRRGMTLVEVATAVGLIAVISTSLIAASILARRLTEVAVYQASVAAIMQGYVEQIKNMPYALLPLSPAAGTDKTTGSYAITYSLPTQKDDVTTDPLIVSPLPEITLASLTPPTVPAAVYDNVKTFDVNRANDLTIRIWVWVEDKTPAGFGTQQAKAITLLYMWQIQDGENTRSYPGVIKNLRSLVPTF
jgi:hypothetical protein